MICLKLTGCSLNWHLDLMILTQLRARAVIRAPVWSFKDAADRKRSHSLHCEVWRTITQLRRHVALVSSQLPHIWTKSASECVFKGERPSACFERLSVPASEPADVFERLNSEMMITKTESFVMCCNPLPAANKQEWPLGSYQSLEPTQRTLRVCVRVHVCVVASIVKRIVLLLFLSVAR